MQVKAVALTVALLVLLFGVEVWAQSLTIDGNSTTNACPGGTVRDGGRACEYGGEHTFDSISLSNGAVLYVTPFNGTDKAGTGNLVLRSTSTIDIDRSSRITAKGAGYQHQLCDNGAGPNATAGGRGGCAVKDSGGGGAHRGRGGQGTKDCFVFGDTQTCQFPEEWEEACGELASSGTSCDYENACIDYDGDPPVNGEPFYHHILEAEFGAAGGGAGGTVLIVGDTVNITQNARILSKGGRGGDSQPKCLPCTSDGDCQSGQTCEPVLDPASQTTQLRCSPCNCTPCQPPSNTCPAGYTCQNLGGELGDVCVNASGTCDAFDPGEHEGECAGTQNSGTCDDCGGGGGGGIINVKSRVASIHPEAFFDVRGGQGGVCPICAGEAGAGSGELQIDGAYVGEVCDGFDNDFNGVPDDGLGTLTCAGGTIPACDGGIPQQCAPDVPACVGPVTDTRPRFVVVVDTSGSMLTDLDGVPTFGDGSATHPGSDTASDADTEDGNNSRLYTAKQALNQVLSAFPHADYALARYHQDVSLRRSCQTASWFECQNNCCSYDDPRDNTAPAFPWIPACVLPDLYPGSGYPGALSSNIDVGWPNQDDCVNYAGSCGAPRRGADVLVGFDAPLEQHLMWLDGQETAFDDSVMPGDHCSFASGGDCELRASGPTPLGGALQAIRDYLEPIVACDDAVPCRKYSVVLLTDGAESCQGDPSSAAAELQNLVPGFPIDTFVVGFSVLAGEQTQLNGIANAGGTGSAFFVGSESELANSLASIIAASTVFEECNDLDDDCDGLVDEDFPEKGNACDDGAFGICQGTGVLVCNAAGDGTECQITNPGASPETEVCNGLDDDCNGLIDEGGVCQVCIPVAEVCNGQDDDCDTVVDNDPIDVGAACGLSIGECIPGMTICDNGQLVCDGDVPPSSELCDGLDNDCDGVTDGMTQPCYTGPAGTEGVGVCRAGSEACDATPGSGVASWADCIGEVVPSGEICDALDNDCNGLVDDQVPDGQGHFTGDPCCAYGDKCGTGVCTEGEYVCAGSQVVCDGGTGPSAEICDELDNDCNGLVDDVPGIGAACVLPNGCLGELVCDLMTGGLICATGTTTNLEICNGVDDDCDGQIDEEPEVTQNDPAVGVICEEPVPPQDQPPCKAGTTVCHSGMIVCEGAIGPEAEICDGIDNDCDGIPDQPDPCPGETVCDKGVCVAPCGTGEFPCPGGFTCVDGYCIPNEVDGGAGGAAGSSGAGGGPDGGVAGSAPDGSTGGAGGTGGASGSGGGTGGSAPDASVGGTGGTGGTTGGSGTGGTGPEPPPDPPENYGLTTGGGGISCAMTPAPRGRALALLGLFALALVAIGRSIRQEGDR